MLGGGSGGGTRYGASRLVSAARQNDARAHDAPYAAHGRSTPRRRGVHASRFRLSNSKTKSPDWRSIATPYLDCAPVATGTRNRTLTEVAGRLRWQGHDAATIGKVLDAFNTHRCVPPLPAAELRSIVQWIAKKPAGRGKNALHRTLYERGQDQCARILSAALARPWPGKAGKTDLAVLRALVHIGRTCGRVQFWASVRQVAEGAGVGKTAAANALRRLEARHAVTLVQPGHAHIERLESGGLSAIRQASTWRLGCTAEGCDCIYQADTKGSAAGGCERDAPPASAGKASPPGYCIGVRAVYTLTQPRADVWRWATARKPGDERAASVGKTAELVYRAIGSKGPVAVGDVLPRLPGWAALVTPPKADTEQRQTYRSKRASLRASVHNALRRLAAVGLVTQTAAGWERTDQDPNTVTGLRSDGALEQQRREHAHDRDDDVLVPRLIDKRRRRLVAVERVLRELPAAPEARDEKRPPGRGPRQNDARRARQNDATGAGRPDPLNHNGGKHACRAHAQTPASGC